MCLQVTFPVLTLLAVSTTTLGRPDSPPPSFSPSAQTYPEEPAKYTYSYAVKDDYTSNNYGADETRDGDITSGFYYVALPDGRL